MRSPVRWVQKRLIAALYAASAAVLLSEASRAAPPTFDDALALYEQGRLAEALDAFRTAARDRSDPETAALAQSNVCFLELDRGDYARALPDCRQALADCRAQGDEAGVARALNNLGLTLEALGQKEEAEASFREALAVNRKLGDAEAQAINLGNLGAIAAGEGRYSAALALFLEVEDLAGRRSSEPWATEQEAVARVNRGAILEKLGAYAEALDLYRPLAAAASPLPPRRRAELLVNRGVLYRNLGDPVSAVASFEEAAALFRREGDKPALSNAFLNLALALGENLARPEEAERAHREALRLAEESGDKTEEVQDLFYLGRFLLGRRRVDEAERVFAHGLTVATASSSAEGIRACREGLGRVARARGDLHGALAHLLPALADIERGRAAQTAGERREGFFGQTRPAYAVTVATLADLARAEPEKGHAERALEIAERALARDLLDALPASRPGRGVAAPLSAAALRQRAGDAALLLYFAGEERLFGFRLTGAGVALADLGPKEPLFEDILALHRELAHGRPPASEHLAQLSRALLAPFAPLPPEPRLYLVADGPLRHLPFELLEDPGYPGLPLLERRRLISLPSASTPVPPPVRRGRGAPVLVGFGDPATPPAGSAATPRNLLAERFSLPPLPRATREIASASARLGGGGETWTGSNATESTFRREAGRSPRVLHFATHALLDAARGQAAILLSPEGTDDGLLVPAEIARLSCRTDLTVLASCRSALGGNGDGRALTSLAGAFLAAGSAGVVATLWDVGDGNTAVFMDELYRQLARGHAPPEALARTKLRLREDPRWQNPALWAGYVLIGEGRAVVAPSRRWVGVAGLLLVAGAMGLWAFRHGNRRFS